MRVLQAKIIGHAISRYAVSKIGDNKTEESGGGIRVFEKHKISKCSIVHFIYNCIWHGFKYIHHEMSVTRCYSLTRERRECARLHSNDFPLFQTHLPEKAFACEYCDFRTAAKTILTDHKRVGGLDPSIFHCPDSSSLECDISSILCDTFFMKKRNFLGI